MQAIQAALIALCLTAAAGERLLKQAPANAYNRTLVPTPAPAPGSSCPAKKSAGAACITEATVFQTNCASYITALTTATGGQIVATTSDQITQLVAGLKSKGSSPTAACCTASLAFLSDACICDASVQALAQAAQNFSPSQFQTVGQVFLNACGYPSCTDTCQLPSS